MEEKLVLQLNASYEPMGVISWKQAVSLWFKNRVEIVEEYDDFDISSVSFTMKCPSVVRLLEYVRGDTRKAKFSRFSVFCRDNFTCQYCGTQPGSLKLNLDHVVPRSRGGETVWENIVTSCLSCNSKKDSKTPEEANMKLKREPFKPEVTPFKFRLTLPKTPDAWEVYVKSWVKNE